MKNELPITEELDFHYLLGLLPPLTGIEEFAWLPELFSILSDDKPPHEKLINLCKYCGGETLKIPTLDQLTECIDALEYFYNVHVQHKPEYPISARITELVRIIRGVYDV